MAKSAYWIELSSRDIGALPPNTIGILPVGAVEQHGPHLPVGTDALINRGLLARALQLLDPQVPVVVLPEQMVGTSYEHLAFPGTLSHLPAAVMEIWTTLLEGAVRAGLRRLLLFNSHGGQDRLLQPVALLLRQRFGVLAAYAGWFDAGYPTGLFPEDELRFGIHGGALETSIMMHLYPDLVANPLLADFPSRSAALDLDFEHLQSDPGDGRMAGFGWMMQDLNPHGAAGDAAAATPEAGRLLVEHAAGRLAALLAEIHRFDLRQLSSSPITDGGEK